MALIMFCPYEFLIRVWFEILVQCSPTGSHRQCHRPTICFYIWFDNQVHTIVRRAGLSRLTWFWVYQSTGWPKSDRLVQMTGSPVEKTPSVSREGWSLNAWFGKTGRTCLVWLVSLFCFCSMKVLVDLVAKSVPSRPMISHPSLLCFDIGCRGSRSLGFLT